MQVFLALVSFAVSAIVATAAYGSGNDVSFAVGVLGIIASVALLANIAAGFYALFGLAIVLGVAVVHSAEAAALPFAVVYGLLAFLAYRVKIGREAQRRQRQQEVARAERMDRYVRQQLGE